jgi:AcrR family transcriptional regulator
VLDPDNRQRPGRPRDANREATILAVVRELVAEVGYDKISYEEVARRAAASKPTLYRRWPTRQDMVIAALKAAPSGIAVTPVDTGSLREDLLILCRRLSDTLGTTDVALTAALLQAGLKDPELCQDMETSMGFTGARLPPSVLQNAAERGELPSGASPFAYEEVTGSVLVLRAMNGLPLDEDYLEQLIDTILLPALARPATQPGRPGIFSGQTH